MFDAKKRAVAIRGSLVGGGRSTTQKRVDAVARALDRAYRAGLEDERKRLGEVVIDHCLRGKDHTAAGYYTAVTGIPVAGVVLDDDRPVVLLGNEVLEEPGCKGTGS